MGYVVKSERGGKKPLTFYVVNFLLMVTNLGDKVQFFLGVVAGLVLVLARDR